MFILFKEFDYPFKEFGWTDTLRPQFAIISWSGSDEATAPPDRLHSSHQYTFLSSTIK